MRPNRDSHFACTGWLFLMRPCVSRYLASRDVPFGLREPQEEVQARVVPVRGAHGGAGRVEPGAGGAGRLAHVRAGRRRDADAVGGAQASPRRGRRGDGDGRRVPECFRSWMWCELLP